MGAAEAYRANGEAPGVEGLDKLYPVRARLRVCTTGISASVLGRLQSFCSGSGHVTCCIYSQPALRAFIVSFCKLLAYGALP